MSEAFRGTVYSTLTFDAAFKIALTQRAFQARCTFHRVSFGGHVAPAELEAIAVESGCRLLASEASRSSGGRKDDVSTERCFVSDQTLILVESSGGHVFCDASSLDATVIDRIRRLFEDDVPSTSAGRVLVVQREHSSLQLAELGRLEASLERDNYTREVVDLFEHVAHDLSSAAPCGRLVLLEGAPGSGKSHLIRGLIATVDAQFILAPSSITGSLSMPELLPLLTRISHGRSATVLVLEDADAALIPRGIDNLDRISEILNAGDGILGELANLRIIVTTNAGRLEIDPALLRPGRLCAHIHLDALEAAHAARVHRRLTGAARPYSEPTTLAQVYAEARRESRRAAFRMESNALGRTAP